MGTSDPQTRGRPRAPDPEEEGYHAALPVMTFYTLQIVIEKTPEDEEYAGYSPTLPGCFSRGRTVDEARNAIRGALSTRLRELVSRGEPLPGVRRFLHVEDVTIGLLERDEDVGRDRAAAVTVRTDDFRRT